MIELFETNPIAFIAGIATIIGAIVAVLAYFRRDDGLRVGGDSRFRARDISGSSVTINTGAIDSFNQVDYSKEDQRSEWKVYEVAFLWHDLEPPGTGAHFQQMSREVEATKEILHNAANQGVLPIAREVRFPQGMTRWVSRDGDVLRSLSKKKMYGSPNSNPSPELGADKENHTSWERYYQVSDCSSSLRNDWYSGI